MSEQTRESVNRAEAIRLYDFAVDEIECLLKWARHARRDAADTLTMAEVTKGLERVRADLRWIAEEIE